MSKQIDNREDVIDSRDIISRIEELEGERGALEATLEEATEAREAFNPDEGGGDEAELDQNLHHAQKELDDWNESAEGLELKTLQAFAREAESYGEDWTYGATLIRESYFTEYCEDLVKDIGDLPRDLPSYLAIDWEATAENLKVDYTEVDFDGVTYLTR